MRLIRQLQGVPSHGDLTFPPQMFNMAQLQQFQMAQNFPQVFDKALMIMVQLRRHVTLAETPLACFTATFGHSRPFIDFRHFA